MRVCDKCQGKLKYVAQEPDEWSCEYGSVDIWKCKECGDTSYLTNYELIVTEG